MWLLFTTEQGSTEPSKNLVVDSYWYSAVQDKVNAPFYFINNSVNLTLVGLGGCRLWILIWAMNIDMVMNTVWKINCLAEQYLHCIEALTHFQKVSLAFHYSRSSIMRTPLVLSKVSWVKRCLYFGGFWCISGRCGNVYSCRWVLWRHVPELYNGKKDNQRLELCVPVLV